jgi:hypothetical protein
MVIVNPYRAAFVPLSKKTDKTMSCQNRLSDDAPFWCGQNCSLLHFGEPVPKISLFIDIWRWRFIGASGIKRL